MPLVDPWIEPGLAPTPSVSLEHPGHLRRAGFSLSRAIHDHRSFEATGIISTLIYLTLRFSGLVAQCLHLPSPEPYLTDIGMNPARHPAGTPAPYGHACQNCARAKCSCTRLEPGGACERCKRLKKDCQPAPRVRRPNQRSSAAKIAKLEAKVDHVLATLPTLQGSTAPGLPNWDPTALAQTQYDGFDQSKLGAAPTPTSISSSSTGNKEIFAAPFLPARNEVLSLLYVPPAMAQEYLDQFRTHHLQYLPFAYIPPDMTSDQLQDKLPFFWVCIMEVLTPLDAGKGDCFGRIAKYIHQRVMVDAAPSMDLLLGMMTFISWGAYSKKPFLNSYVHMLMGLVAELGINQSASGSNSIMQDFKFAIGMKRNESGIRTLEERRAVLGCFLISSSTAISLSRIDAMRWTPHMEESLSVLTEAKECLEDEILVAMVKIYLVLDRMYHVRRDGETINPPSFYLKTFQMQLDAVKQEIPGNVQLHRAIQLYFYSAEFTINELALDPSVTPHLPDLERIERLYASLLATQSWLDVWLDLKAVEYMQVSSVVFFQWARAILNLYRLTTLEDPAWSKSFVQETANILDFLNSAIAAVKEYPEYLHSEEGRDINLLEKGLKMMEALKSNWEPKLFDLWGMSMPANEIDENLIQPNALPPGYLHPIDEAWMMEFLGAT
ncbi:unnamed protein product [Penicillium olsonii]|nr:unnamed protein product [Penicillium olsonii]